MTFLGTDDREARQAQQLAQLGPLTQQVGDPALFEGIGDATGLGIGRGLTSIVAAASALDEFMPTARFREPLANLLGVGDLYREQEQKYRDLIESAMDATRLDPGTTGFAGNLTYGVGGVLVPGAVGTALGGPILGATFAGGGAGSGTYYDMLAEGVDPDTAMGTAGITGGITALAFGLPAGFGLRTMTRVGTGTALNVGAGMGERVAMGSYLEGQGYTEIAERYKAFDGLAIATDAVLGAAFGALPAPRGTRPAQAATDAALASNAVLQAEVDLAPGLPVNAQAAAANIRAQELATRQLLSGEPVTANALDHQFVPRPENPHFTDAAFVQAFRDSGLPGLFDEIDGLEADLAARGRVSADEPLPKLPPAIPRATNKAGERTLTGEDAAIEDRFAERLAADPEAAFAEYAKLKESEGGKVLNTDTMRELDPDYRADRTRSAAVHEPASWAVKELYRRKLREAPRAGEDAVVMFTGGGTGAGKSSALESIAAMKLAKDRAQIVYDTNLNGLESSKEKIDQALAAGKKVRIAFVLRDPIEALVKGALPRAESKGRTVPLAKHAETHADSAKTLQRLARHYADNPDVIIDVIDNTRGKGKARPADIALAATFDYSDLAKRLRAALDKEYERGAISEAVYRGTAGVDAAAAGLRRAADTAEGRAGSADGRAVRQELQGVLPDRSRGNGPDAQRQDGSEAGLTRVATAVVDDTPDLPVIGENGVEMPAAAVLSDADREIARAEQDAPAFEAAVDCFLRRGA